MRSLALAIVYIVIWVIVSLVTKYKYKKIMKINFLYTTLWCFCGITAMYNNLGLLKPSLQIHIMIIVSIIVFNILYLTFAHKMDSINISLKDLDKSVNQRLVYEVNIVAFCGIFVNLIKALKIIFTYGFDLTLVRTSVYNTLSESSNMFLQLFTRAIPNSIFIFTIVVSAIYLALNSKKYLHLALIDIIIGTISFGGRTLILSFILSYIATICVLNAKVKIKVKKQYVILTIGILWLITALRTKNIFGFFDTIILYLSGSLSFLEYIFTHAIEYGLNEKMYGYMTFAAIIEPIILILKVLFNIKAKVPSYYFNIHAQNFVNISEKSVSLYNNNTTFFYNFVMDFGMYGWIISLIVILLILILLERKFFKNPSVKVLCFIVFLYVNLLESTISYGLNSISTSLVLILFMLLNVKIVFGKSTNKDGVIESNEK